MTTHPPASPEVSTGILPGDKRILFVSPQPYFQWRGSPIRVAFDTQALSELGYKVDLLTLPIGADRPQAGVKLFRVSNPFHVKNVPIGPSLHKAFFDLLLFFRALPMVLRHRYTAIHAVEEAAVFACILAFICGARLIFEKHSDPASHRSGRLKNLVLACYRRFERFSIRCSDAVIATGAGLVDQVRKFSPLKPVYHIFDIPSSLVEPNAGRAAELRRQLGAAPGDVLALYAGSFAVYQGIDLMFESIANVAARNSRVRFIIIGGSPDEIAQRQAWLAERGAADRTKFIGTVPPDELPHYLAAVDILLSPRSSGINTPLKLLDYLKAGRPIVATDNSANRQILDEHTGMLAPATAEAYAEAILRLADDPSLREQLGRNGRKLIDELYNFQEFKKRLKTCYEQLSPA